MVKIEQAEQVSDIVVTFDHEDIDIVPPTSRKPAYLKITLSPNEYKKIRGRFEIPVITGTMTEGVYQAVEGAKGADQ